MICLTNLSMFTAHMCDTVGSDCEEEGNKRHLLKTDCCSFAKYSAEGTVCVYFECQKHTCSTERHKEFH